MPRIDRLWYEIDAQTKGFDEGVLQAGNKLKAFTEYAAGRPVAVIGALASAAVVAGYKLTQMAATFEVEMKKVQTVAGNNAKMMQSLSDGVLKLFERLPVQSTQELSQGLYDIISSGIPAGEALQFLETAAKAAAGGFTSVDIVVDGLTTTFNAFKSQGKSVTEIADLMAKTVDVGKIEFSELAASMGNVAGTAATLGIPLEDILALTAQLTLNGVKGAEALTGVRSALANIVKPNEQLRKDFPDLAAKFDLAHLKAVGLTKFLIELNEATKGNERAMAAVLPDIQGFAAALTLLKDDGRGAAEIQRELAESVGAVDEKLKTVTETAIAQSQILRNQLHAALIDLGNQILPTVNAELRGLVGLLDLVNGTVAKIEQSSAEATLRTLSQTIAKLAEPRQREELTRLRQALAQLVGGGAGITTAIGDKQLAGLTPERLEAVRAGLDTLVNYGKLAAGELRTVQDNLMRVDLELARRPGTPAASGATPTAPTVPNAPAREDPDARRRREQAQKEAADLVKQVEDELARLTPTLVDDMLLKLKRFKEDAAPLLAQGLFPREMYEQFTQLEERLIGLQEQSEDLDTALARIRGREGEARAEDFAWLSRKQEGLALAKQAAQTDAERKAIEEQIRKIEEVRAKLVERRTQSNQKDTDEARRQREEQSRKVREQAQTIKDAASGALELARAFGVVGDETERSLRNIIDIAAGVGPLKDAIDAFKGGTGSFGSIATAALPVLGGLAGLVSGLFAGDAQMEQARRETNNALRELTRAVLDLKDVYLQDVSTGQAEADVALVERLKGLATSQHEVLARDRFGRETIGRDTFVLPTGERILASGEGRGPGRRQNLQSIAKLLGIADQGASVDDALAALLKRLGDIDKQYGTNLADFVRREDPEGLIKAVQQLPQALQDAIARMGQFGADVAGIIQRVSYEFDVLGEHDPTTRIRAIVNALMEAGSVDFGEFRDEIAALQNVDLTDEQRRGILQQILDRLAQGGNINFGSFTPEQFRDLVKQIADGTLGQAAGAAGTGGFHVDRSITEVTGSYLRGLLTTANVWHQQTAENTAIIARALAGVSASVPTIAPPVLPGTSTTGAGGITINGLQISVSVNVGGGTTPSEAQAIGDAAGRAAAGALGDELDRILGERQRSRLRAEGSALML